MKIDELKEILLQEHEREKKISIRNFIIVGTILFGGVGAVLLFFPKQIGEIFNSVFSDGVPTYIKFLLPVIFLSFLVYPALTLMASLKCPKKIEEVMDLLAQGKVADNFFTQKVYKTTIPLLKIDFKLNAFHYLCFYMNRQVYKLPVPFQLIATTTAMLNGANMEKISGIWNELNQNEEAGTEQASVPLKTIEEFKSFAATALMDKAVVMEKGRKKALRNVVIMVLAIGLAIGGFIYYNYHKGAQVYSVEEYNAKTAKQSNQNNTRNFMIAFGVMMLGSCGYYFYQKNKRNNASVEDGSNDYTRFKETIFRKMVDFLNPDFEYVKAGYIGHSDIKDSGIFLNYAYDITGNDLIAGRHQGVAFQYSDVSMRYKKNFSDEKEAPDSVFDGQYFIAKFNKQFTTSVYVFSKPSLKGAFLNNQIHTYLAKYLPKVTLEDPEFNKQFDVYCSDQIAARYILSTSLMQNIKDLSVLDKKTDLFIAFHNNKVSVLNNSKWDKFEVDIYTKIKPELLESFYSELYKQLRIIEEMKLDVKIWK